MAHGLGSGLRRGRGVGRGRGVVPGVAVGVGVVIGGTKRQLAGKQIPNGDA